MTLVKGKKNSYYYCRNSINKKMCSKHRIRKKEVILMSREEKVFSNTVINCLPCITVHRLIPYKMGILMK